MTTKIEKEIQSLDQIAKDIAVKLPKDQELLGKVSLILDIANMFSEAKRKET